jgi:putative ABC transport system permease protein
MWMNFRMALRALPRNPLRTFLTMLGIVIGVASVITMLAMARGATQRVQEQIAGLGSSVLFVWAGHPRGSTAAGADTRPPVHLELLDAYAIASECPAVRAVSGIDQTMSQCVFQDHNWNTLVVGAGVDHPQVRNLVMDSGAWFSESDVSARARVAVLGPVVAEELFGSLDPIGQTMRIRGQPFTVLGVLARKGGSGGGGDEDDRVYIPVTTSMVRLDHQRWLDYAMISAQDDDRVDEAASQIQALLRQRHRLQEDAPDDFSLHTQTEIASMASTQGAILTLFLGGVAAISLLVGGIGIMNIMLVSVTERIREIGIRLAVGARGRDIMVQFLAESVTLSGLGGVIGIALGLGASKLFAHLSSWPFSVSTASVVMSFGFSVFVGVFFGLYPAVKAAGLDPIEALRTE